MAKKCTVRDGRFIDPCKDLMENCEVGNPPKGKQRGIWWWQYTHLPTGKPSRSFFGIKSTQHPNGMLFNFCPWCGVSIDAPCLRPIEGEQHG